MPELDGFEELSPPESKYDYSSQHVEVGVPISKTVRLANFSPDEFEQFVEEWLTTLNDKYEDVKRSSGAGDKGVDVAGFKTRNRFEGAWDNYQCKQYGDALTPTDVYVEFGKIIYYSFIGEYTPPDNYYFVSRLGVGTKLGRLLNKPTEMKKALRENWKKYCQTKITKEKEIKLENKLLDYFDKFDFSSFGYKTAVQLVDEHSKTPYHAVRFGGGLPKRPLVPNAPTTPTQNESRYIEQILEAYSDHLSKNLKTIAELKSHIKLEKHFLRQRENFFHTECLRSYARDSVPPGTFEALLDEFNDGVIDILDDDHDDGYQRMKEVLSEAKKIVIDSNALKSALKIKDRQGACHHLANNDQLKWVPEDE